MQTEAIQAGYQAYLRRLSPEQQQAAIAMAQAACANINSGGVMALSSTSTDDAGGPMGGASGDCSCKVPGAGSPTPAVDCGAGAPALMVIPQCYRGCRQLSPCLLRFMENARLRFDEHSWLELAKNEGQIVHFRDSVGAAPTYQTVLPIAANQAMIFRQEAQQQLPWEPGVIKIEPTWTGTAAPGAVIVRIYSGPRDGTAITDPAASGLIQMGNDLDLGDFICGDDCAYVPFPELFNCQTAAIPDTRAVFVEIAAGAIGGATISAIAISVIKRHTRKIRECAKKFDLVLDF